MLSPPLCLSQSRPGVTSTLTARAAIKDSPARHQKAARQAHQGAEGLGFVALAWLRLAAAAAAADVVGADSGVGVLISGRGAGQSRGLIGVRELIGRVTADTRAGRHVGSRWYIGAGVTVISLRQRLRL